MTFDHFKKVLTIIIKYLLIAKYFEEKNKRKILQNQNDLMKGELESEKEKRKKLRDRNKDLKSKVKEFEELYNNEVSF